MVIYIALAVIFVVVIAFILYKKKGAKKMPQGLQVFDSSGNIILDYTEATYMYYGKASTGTSNGSITDSRIDGDSFIMITNVVNKRNNGTVIANTNSESDYYADFYIRYPMFNITDGAITWTYPASWSSSGYTSGIADVTFVYGGRAK